MRGVKRSDPKKDWKSIVIEQSRIDKATNLKTVDKNINLVDGSKIPRTQRITFLCHCGNKGEKCVRNIVEKSGCFCSDCSKKNAQAKQLETCKEKYGETNPNKTREVRQKVEDTNMAKYGFKSGLENPDIRRKVQETCIQKYGVSNPFKSKKIMEKAKNTFIANNPGLTHPQQREDVKKKQRETTFINLGVYHNSQSEKIKKQKEETCQKKWGFKSQLQVPSIKERIKETNLIKLGCEYPMQSEEIRDKSKDTCRKKYGVDYPNQNREIFERMQKKRFVLKDYTFASGKTIKCQGHEDLALDELEKHHGYTYDDYTSETDFWYTQYESEHRYYTDIEFLRRNIIIEVKSKYTFEKEIGQNFLKATCVLKEGYNFEFWIYKSKNTDDKIIFNRLRFELNDEIVNINH